MAPDHRGSLPPAVRHYAAHSRQEAYPAPVAAVIASAAADWHRQRYSNCSSWECDRLVAEWPHRWARLRSDALAASAAVAAAAVSGIGVD